ncbi:MAG: MYG1 family protein [Patescibacteria group bacterium]
MKIVTHNGKFHADEVFAVATILLAHEGEDIEIVRTRDPLIIKTGDIVVDVGGEYNPSLGKFDHHQTEGAGIRENGIPYSSFGIVWKKYGEKVCNSRLVSDTIDKFLVMSLDALDNGIDIQKPMLENIYEYTAGDLVDAFNPSWRETINRDESFKEAVEVAKKVLRREIIRTRDKQEGKAMVETVFAGAVDKRIIVLEDYLPWSDVLCVHTEPMFVVYPDPDKKWRVQAVRDNPHLFENRKDFPSAWGGKTGRELSEITEVSDAIFCHKGLFLCGAQTKEGAISLAKKALDA